jgi:opacity protein-like surface antigen
MKKSLAAFALLSTLLSAPAWAASAPGTFTFAGPYGGLDLGFSSANDHVETGSITNDLGSTGFAYGGYLGYGVQFRGPWYVGGELGLGDTTGSSKVHSASITGKESQDYLFSADLRAGKVIGQTTLGYAKLGWGHAEFTQSASTAATSVSHSAGYNGIRFGAGAETLLTNNLAGRLEAVYTDYDSQTSNNVKFAPSDVAVRLGVSYYFY